MEGGPQPGGPGGPRGGGDQTTQKASTPCNAMTTDAEQQDRNMINSSSKIVLDIAKRQRTTPAVNKLCFSTH